MHTQKQYTKKEVLPESKVSFEKYAIFFSKDILCFQSLN